MSTTQSQSSQHNPSMVPGNSTPSVPSVVLRHLDSIIEENQQSQELERRQYDTQAMFFSEDEEEDEEVEAPLLTEIAEKVNGDSKLITMCSFTFLEIVEIWEMVKGSVLSSSGRGKKPKYSPLDRLFLLLIFLKHGPSYNKFGLHYELDGGTSCRMIHRMLDLISEPLKCHLMEKRTMRDIDEAGKLCATHPGIKLICDVHFQPTNRPTGTFAESKIYYSGKHHEYGVKVETSHYPDGVCTTVSVHYTGSTHDFTIFKDMASKYRHLLLKKDDEKGKTDDMPLANKYPDQWILIADSAYQSADQYVRAIVMKKKKFIKTSAENAYYRSLSKDRVICENFYGRLLSLFGVIRNKYKYEHNMYDKFFMVCTCLTNYHLRKNPLRNDDRGFYQAVMQKRLDKSLEKIKKNKESKERYNARIKARKRQRDSNIDVRETIRILNE
jgi:hypothetical protein